MRFLTVLGLAAGVGGFAATALADIMAQSGPRGFDNITNTEDFQSYGDFEDPGTPFSSPGGFDFDITDNGGSFVIWAGDGGVGFNTRSLYQNGGANGMTTVSLTSGGDINQIQFDAANGFGPADPHNVWIRAYNNGSPAGFDFEFFVAAGSTLTVWSTDGTVFDELRVQSYGATAIEGLETQFGAVSIDNIIVGQGMPAPGAIALLAVAGLAPRRRRR